MILGIAGLVLSLIAVAVSAWAARTLVKAERETVGSAEVSDMYSDFRRITELRLNNWQHTHILEPPANYERTKRLLQLALPEVSRREAAQHLLKERAVAQGIFQLFEQTLYQLEDAHRIDHRREQFLNEVLTYMTTCLFLNPRLLYLWSEEGGGLCADFERSTKDYYNKHVGVTHASEQDTKGIFEHDLNW